MQHMEIWFVILFLSRKKFRAEQMFVLSSSMKLGPIHLKQHVIIKVLCRNILLGHNTSMVQHQPSMNLLQPK